MGSHRVGHDWSDLAAAAALRNLIAFETNTVEIMCVCSVTHLCLTLCNPMDCSPPGSSVLGIFQARIVEWVAISSSGGSSQPRDLPKPRVSCISSRFFTTEPPGKPPLQLVLAPKVHSCPWSPQSQADRGDIIPCTCGCRGAFPFSLAHAAPGVQFWFGVCLCL